MRKLRVLVLAIAIIGLLLASFIIAASSAPQATSTSFFAAPALISTRVITATPASPLAAPKLSAAIALSVTQAHATAVPVKTNLRTPEQAAMAAAGGQKLGGTVSVLGTWDGSEQDTFMAIIKPFEDATGVTVQYEGTHNLNVVLAARVQKGNLPDLANLPGPGQMAQFAQQGKLVNLGAVLDMPDFSSDYAKGWTDLGTVNGKLVGVFINASMKGLIWYDPKVWQAQGFQPPKTWADLLALSQQMESTGVAPWCIGLESGVASGWPGTDWLEDIVLRQAGEQVYNDWWQGKIAWTSPQIKQAWQTWGQIVANPKMVYGGPSTVLTMAFSNSGNPLFTSPPGCYMLHQPSFTTDLFTTNNKNIKPVDDFNFFLFPPFDANAPTSMRISGDLFGMFKDTPQARALIKYLVSPEAQAMWVQRDGAISPNEDVPLSLYPDPLSQRIAPLMVNSQSAVFDASDLMPDAMNTAFWKAVLDYVQNPQNLDSILQNLDTVQKDAYK